MTAWAYAIAAQTLLLLLVVFIICDVIVYGADPD